jgi:NAD(P)-dependent dehydrogenase (short-subunit alcohol dehydrogenase family)
MGHLENKVCIITGAAGSIGLASAELFARESVRVMLVNLAEANRRRAAHKLPSERVAFTLAKSIHPLLQEDVP